MLTKASGSYTFPSDPSFPVATKKGGGKGEREIVTAETHFSATQLKIRWLCAKLFILKWKNVKPGSNAGWVLEILFSLSEQNLNPPLFKQQKHHEELYSLMKMQDKKKKQNKTHAKLKAFFWEQEQHASIDKCPRGRVSLSCGGIVSQKAWGRGLPTSQVCRRLQQVNEVCWRLALFPFPLLKAKEVGLFSPHYGPQP